MRLTARKDNIIMNKKLDELSLEFTVAVTKMCDQLIDRKIFANQIIRSASSIGANVFEANYAQSNLDFINKMEIALKECYETQYWLKVLREINAITQEEFEEKNNICGKIRRIIIASIKTIKAKIDAGE